MTAPEPASPRSMMNRITINGQFRPRRGIDVPSDGSRIERAMGSGAAFAAAGRTVVTGCGDGRAGGDEGCETAGFAPAAIGGGMLGGWLRGPDDSPVVCG